MSKDSNKTQFLKLTDREQQLFDKVLEDNKHLSATHFFELYAWCKLAMAVANIGDPPTREDLKIIGEFRLLSNALKLNPKTAQEVTTDLGTALQHESTRVKE